MLGTALEADAAVARTVTAELDAAKLLVAALDEVAEAVVLTAAAEVADVVVFATSCKGPALLPAVGAKSDTERVPAFHCA